MSISQQELAAMVSARHRRSREALAVMVASEVAAWPLRKREQKQQAFAEMEAAKRRYEELVGEASTEGEDDEAEPKRLRREAKVLEKVDGLQATFVETVSSDAEPGADWIAPREAREVVKQAVSAVFAEEKATNARIAAVNRFAHCRREFSNLRQLVVLPELPLEAARTELMVLPEFPLEAARTGTTSAGNVDFAEVIAMP